jgi:hypothetical protein
MKRLLALVVLVPALAAASLALAQSFSVELGNRHGPAQPIRFPHDIHAGKLGMDCLYCHYGADKSPVANVPPVSTCMGCHKMAVTDRPEVQKLAGYWQRGEAIPWVHVYWLPDYVKFNHERHVKAGLSCQTCHGPVQTMKVVYRYSSLKMGWCVGCHRQHQNDPRFPASMDCLICHH